MTCFFWATVQHYRSHITNSNLYNLVVIWKTFYVLTLAMSMGDKIIGFL